MRFGLRLKFLAPTVALLILGMVLVLTVTFQQARKTLQETMMAQLRQQVSAATLSIESWFGDMRATLYSWSTQRLLTETLEEGEDALASRSYASHRLRVIKEGYPMFESINLADASGMVVASSDESLVGKVRIDDRSYFGEAMKGRFVVSEVISSRQSGNPVVGLAVPVTINGAEKGVLVSALDLAYFSQRFVLPLKTNETIYAYVVDEQGLLIAHPLKKNLLSKEIAREDFIQRMVREKKGMVTYDWYGVEKVAVYADIPDAKWVFAMTVGIRDFFAPLTETLVHSALITAGMALAMGMALFFLTRSIISQLRRIAGGLQTSAAQVAAAGGGVEGSSHILANGAAEQTTAISETSSSMEEVSAMIHQNSDNALQANGFMKEAAKTVAEANRAMSNLLAAMTEIASASQETSQIIKTIDEIAFQTNLLALNAAVEAARAGEAGAGFAVVAQEVRTLAGRSAEAARNTSRLISGIVKQIAEGDAYVKKTGEVFAEVDTRVRRSAELLDEIAQASRDQADGVVRIKSSVNAMQDVIHRNAASAQESAAAAEELNAQSERLNVYVAQLFHLLQGGPASPTLPSSSR